jgi:lysyl endopeptidase
MSIPFKNSIAITFSLIASFASMSHAMGSKVSGEPVAARTEKVLVQAMRAEGLSSQRVTFTPVSQEKWKQVREQAAQQKVVQIGFARGVSDMIGGAATAKTFSALKFSPVSADKSVGGVAALLEIHSPQAQSLRIGIDVAALPEGIELRFRGNGAAQALQGVLGPHTTNDIKQMTQGIHTYWTPITDGDTQWIEIFAPDVATAAKVKLNFNSISHIDSSISTGLKPSMRISGVVDKRSIDIGDAGSCNIDVACVDNPSQALRNAIASVAKMVFTTSEGLTGLCTGTLVNDTDPSSQIPYLIGGNHCFDNKLINNGAPTGLSNKTASQMQAVASTLNTYFNFQSLTCGSNSNVDSFSQLTRGSVFLYNEAGYDALLLRLNDSPPVGAYLTGYDPNTTRNGDGIFGIHHPGGDLKKISQGTVTGTATLQVFTSPRREVFTEVAWSRGVTEGGSSGSAIYTFDGQYYLRGTLWGGVSSCAEPNAPDYYSFLPNYYPSIAQYIGGQSPPQPPQPNYTDIWYNASESGWGLNITHHRSPNNQIFAVWYTYGEDGLPRWYTMSGGQFVNSTTFVGGAFRTVGPPQTTSFFNKNLVGVTPVGQVTLTFDANGRDATFNYSFGATNYTRRITRLPF